MNTKTQWAVITYAGEWEKEVIYGPFGSVAQAAASTPPVYTAALLPILNGSRSCVEDNAASDLFRSLRRLRSGEK